jgi:hypothetical protein
VERLLHHTVAHRTSSADLMPGRPFPRVDLFQPRDSSACGVLLC